MAEIVAKAKDFFMQCSRVWAVMRKPTKEEFKMVAQASGFGILIIGAIGFAVSLLMRFFYTNGLF